MKKTFFIFIFILAAASVFAQRGIIRELSGTVELKTSGAVSFSPANTGDTVGENTVISTGFKSSALLAVGSSLITVRPLTRLTLTEIMSTSGAETLNVSLQTGRVRVDVNPPAGTRANLTVISPVATASVRGTSFEFDTRNVWVSKGKVAYSGNRGHMHVVGGGLSGKLNDDGKAEDPLYIKLAEFLPPAPVGTDSTSGATGDSSSYASAVIVIMPAWDFVSE